MSNNEQKPLHKVKNTLKVPGMVFDFFSLGPNIGGATNLTTCISLLTLIASVQPEDQQGSVFDTGRAFV